MSKLKLIKKQILKIPYDFNILEYLALNLDIKKLNLTDNFVKLHYIQFGKNQNRIYKSNQIPVGFTIDYYYNWINTKQKYDIFPGFIHKNLDPTEEFKLICMQNNNYIQNIILPENSYFNDYININNIIITKYIDRLPDNSLKKIHNLKLYNNFILIVDFPNCGGGTTFFINTIISRYKHNNNFVIVRNINNKLVVNVNEEYLLTTTFNEQESIYFLNNIKDKIIKIFVNHTLYHNNSFILELFKLNKQVTTITHDYSLLFTKYDPYYFEIPNLKRNIIDINLYDQIITQNESNLNIYNRYLTNNKIKICPLPDFKKSDIKIITTNSITIIGIIGAISEIKGKNHIADIINYYKNNPSIKIIVFGIIHIPNFTNFYKYNNILELNNLLIKYRPNILLETSIWPETYSYTLTIAMLTQLPIVYLYKSYNSVIQNRLNNYNTAYKYNSIEEMNNLIVKYKQNYFYTIKPEIYYHNFWSTYFNYNMNNMNNINKMDNIDNMDNINNLVIITSKIYTSSNKLSYVSNRSIYSVSERFNQTIDTINSIKKYIPNSYIILIDNSIFENNDFLLQLINSVDKFINITDNSELNYYTDTYPYKAFAEICQLLNLYKILKQMDLDSHKFKNMFKISGRYVINNTFNYTNYNNSDNIIKQNMNVSDRIYWYTSFYKININFINKLFDSLQIIFDNKEQYTQYDLEVIYSIIFKDDFILVDHLGVTQNVSVWNDNSEI